MKSLPLSLGLKSVAKEPIAKVTKKRIKKMNFDCILKISVIYVISCVEVLNWILK